jgi:hypothetical protein
MATSKVDIGKVQSAKCDRRTPHLAPALSTSTQHPARSTYHVAHSTSQVPPSTFLPSSLQ